MQGIPTRTGRPALRQGLIFGAISGIIGIALFALGTFLSGLGTITFILAIIVPLAAYVLAGLFASQVTGKVSTGTIAGLWAGLFGSVIYSIGLFALAYPNIDTFRQAAQKAVTQQGSNFTYTNSVIITGLVFFLIIVIIASILLGLGVGAIGGLIGKSRAKVQPPAYQETFYQPPPTNQY